MTADISSREARLAQKQAVDAELTKARTEMVKLRMERDALVVGLRKGELLKKYDAKVALGFLLTGLRQRLMSLSYALPPRLAGRSEHEIRMLLDSEVRSALKDIASWPERMANPNWSEDIDEDLRPPPEAGGNGDGVEGGAAKQERVNAKRRAAYAKSKEQT